MPCCWTPSGRASGDLLRRLMMYRLRAKVEIEDRSDALRGRSRARRRPRRPARSAGAAGRCAAARQGLVLVDPRLAQLGGRAVLPAATRARDARGARLRGADRRGLRAARLALGVPDGSRDLVVERSTLLESGFEELHGVDFKKGCFVGQELTARMKYRGLVRKRLLPVAFKGRRRRPARRSASASRRPARCARASTATASRCCAWSRWRGPRPTGCRCWPARPRSCRIKPDLGQFLSHGRVGSERRRCAQLAVQLAQRANGEPMVPRPRRRPGERPAASPCRPNSSRTASASQAAACARRLASSRPPARAARAWSASARQARRCPAPSCAAHQEDRHRPAVGPAAAGRAPLRGRLRAFGRRAPRSALLTTAMSGISAMPAFMYCRLSPEPGWTQSTTVSATIATSVSDWPTPTVSTITRS